jgi:Phosphotransferase enzyme family
VAKVTVDEREQKKLANEADAIRRLGPLLSVPLLMPTISAEDEGLLVLRAVEWTPRLRSWRLDPEVARALAEFNAAGFKHGDCAPWNLLRTEAGFVLVDWEEGGDAESPLEDVITHLARTNSLLGRPSPQVLRAGFEGRGWVGAALRAAAEGANLSLDAAVKLIASRLELRSVI